MYSRLWFVRSLPVVVLLFAGSISTDVFAQRIAPPWERIYYPIGPPMYAPMRIPSAIVVQNQNDTRANGVIDCVARGRGHWVKWSGLRGEPATVTLYEITDATGALAQVYSTPEPNTGGAIRSPNPMNDTGLTYYYVVSGPQFYLAMSPWGKWYVHRNFPVRAASTQRFKKSRQATGGAQLNCE